MDKAMIVFIIYFIVFPAISLICFMEVWEVWKAEEKEMNKNPRKKRCRNCRYCQPFGKNVLGQKMYICFAQHKLIILTNNPFSKLKGFFCRYFMMAKSRGINVN